MIVEVEHWKSDADGEFSEDTLRKKIESRGYSVSRYVYSPGVYFPDHTHGFGKIDGVVSGRFRMTMGGVSVVLKAGDCMFVPAGEIHSAEVVGNESVVSLDGSRK